MKPENINWITPYLVVVDVQRAVDFYCQAFGFDNPTDQYYDEKTNKLIFCKLSYKNSYIMIGAEGKLGAVDQSPNTGNIDSPVGIYVYCNDVDQLYKRAIQCGAVSLYAPGNKFWGDRVCKLKDLDGHIWGFASIKILKPAD